MTQEIFCGYKRHYNKTLILCLVKIQRARNNIMSLRLTTIVLSIYSIAIAASITCAISFRENLTKNFNSKREDSQISNSSSIDYNGLTTTMKMIWMRCEIFKKNFVTQNKHSNISDDVCLIYMIQRLIHIKRQRERLEDYFTFRQGWKINLDLIGLNWSLF